MKYGLPKIRGLDHLNYGNIPEFFKDNWLKIVIIIFALFILLKKDISFNFDLRAAGGQVHDQQSYEPRNASMKAMIYRNEIESTEEETDQSSQNSASQKSGKENTPQIAEASMSLPAFQIDSKKTTQPTEDKASDSSYISPSKKKAKDNRANHFYNIAFILHPENAKKRNVDPEVVKEKNDNCYKYVKRYADIAVTEMKKYGVPASITLAQGLLESDAGGSRLAKSNNNHFGIKCFSKKCKKGHCSNFTDDTHKDFFRAYKNVWQSYRSHSQFLQAKRYKHLQELNKKDYKGWAHGLRKAGYATDKSYAEKLIKIIEEMELFMYDFQ